MKLMKIKRYAVSVMLLANLLTGCQSSDSKQPLSQNDVIADGLVQANAKRAGETGVPVELISLTSADNGAFSAVLANEQQNCRYTIQGSLREGKVGVAKEIRQECAGAGTVVAVGEVVPRNKAKNPNTCTGDERERLVCFAEAHRANHELVLVITG